MSDKDLALVTDKELAEFFGDDVEVGTEDMGDVGQLPIIKITHPMALVKDKDAYILGNGSHAEMGTFYHTERKEQMSEVKVNIMYVGQFELPSYESEKETKMTYVFGGIMQDDNSPFISFVRGMSLQNVWSFNGEVTNIRNRFKVPMYALNVTMKLDKRTSDKYGETTVYKFEIDRDKKGLPVIEKDLGRLTFIKDHIQDIKSRIRQMVDSQETNDPYLDQNNNFEQEMDQEKAAKEAEEVLTGK